MNWPQRDGAGHAGSDTGQAAGVGGGGQHGQDKAAGRAENQSRKEPGQDPYPSHALKNELETSVNDQSQDIRNVCVCPCECGHKCSCCKRGREKGRGAPRWKILQVHQAERRWGFGGVFEAAFPRSGVPG